MYTELFLILIFISLAIFLVRHFRHKPNAGSNEPGIDIDLAQTAKPNKITRLVKGYLDVMWYLFLALTVLMPIVGGVISVGYFSEGGNQWGVDLNAFMGIEIDLEQLTDMAANTEGLRSGVISGKTLLNFETLSVTVWYIFIAVNEVMLLFVLYGLKQMRDMFASLVTNMYFTLENAGRLKKIGIAVISGNIIIPIIQYFGGRMMLDDITFNIPGVEIYPAFQNGGTGVFLGLLILILSGVAREAANIYQEQLGTI